MNNRQVIHALLAILLGAFLLLAGSCREDSPESGSDGMAGKTVDNAGPIRVVCTTGMIADIVERIGGSQLDVYCMMGPGVDPHLYQATTGDVQALADADIVFYNGLHLEAKLGELLEKLGQQRPVVAVTDGIDRGRLDKPAQFEGLYDPHVWMDVELWMSAAETVRTNLQELRPELHDEFEGNWMDLWTDLDVLQLAVTEALGTVPEESRVLITAHDAFNYFGKAYGYEVRGLQGISTQAEAGTADVRELAEFIVERRIPAIFVESSVPQRNIEAVQAACSSRGFEVQIGGELYSDAMGTAGTPDGTYDGMIRHNVMTIVQALGGTIPYSISDENGNPLWERPAWTE
ncbi:MAG: zinc ABC transporter substrate-binding protein [Planctomycetales bacterium]|nr:zinc ABC transporter substrate-binding protein [bacterium]UNM09035.1 MAG: zinc ABC transporter substrate-binding protein [Planctomycetales bacterium]